MKTSALVACLGLVAFVGAAVAADYTWTGGASGDWTTPGNWDAGAGYPKAGDTAKFTSSVTISSNFDIGGEEGTGDVLTLDIGSGATLTIDASISGEGGVTRQGDGHLVLKKANAFKGVFSSIAVANNNNGHTTVNDAGALGVNSAVFCVNADATYKYAQFIIEADSKDTTLTFDIPIEHKSSQQARGIMFNKGSVVFNKQVKANRLDAGVTSGAVPEIRFKEKFVVSSWSDMDSWPSTCHVYFEKGYSSGLWYLASAASTFHFGSADNSFNFGATNASYGSMCGISISCEVADVFKSCAGMAGKMHSIGWRRDKGGDHKGSKIYLNGYDQTYPLSGGVSYIGGCRVSKNEGTFGYDSPVDKPANVIFAGDYKNDIEFNGNFWGAAGLTWNVKDANREFTYHDVTSATRGSLKALGGVIRLMDGAEFLKLSGVEVGATGKLVLDATAGETLSAKEVSVAAGGLIDLAEGKVLSCRHLSYDGTLLTNGTYTAGVEGAEFLSGAGTVKVDDTVVCTWIGPDGGNWSDSDNWQDGELPAAGTKALIDSGVRVVLDQLTAQLAELNVVDGTLEFAAGWDTVKVQADAVVVGALGTITCAGPFATAADKPASRVNIECGTLTVAAGGKIDVDAKGWTGGTSGQPGLLGVSAAGFGPGAAITSCGSSHGGLGGTACFQLDNNKGPEFDRGDFGYVYDDPYAPLLPGSGAWSGGANCAGGGAVRIVASGAVRVDGSILASSKDYANDSCRGSGGSVWISCSSFSGSGSIAANGGSSSLGVYPQFITYYTEGKDSAAGNGRVGGGGMVRVEYSSLGSLDGMRISAAPGYYLGDSTGFGRFMAVNHDKYRIEGDLGTLTFSDNAIVDALLGKGLSGRLVGVTNYTYASDMDWTWGHVRFAGEGADVSFGGNLTITGEDSRLEIGGVETRVDRKVLVPNRYAGKAINTCTVVGSLTLNGGAFDIRAAETNATTTWGGEVVVGGDLTVGAGGYLYPWSDPVNLGSPHFTVGGAFTVDAGGFVQADRRGGAACGGSGSWDEKTRIGSGQRGWLGDNNRSYGLGTSGSRGAAHGGVGGGGYFMLFGAGGTVEDEGVSGVGSTVIVPDEWTADYPGAGGGASGYGRGGLGGGLVYVEAKGAVIVNGTVSANGSGDDSSSGSLSSKSLYAMFGSGAGGGVHLSGASFSGTGRIEAKGGDAVGSIQDGTGAWAGKKVGYASGCGGGGRVVIVTGADVEGKIKILQDKSSDYRSDPVVQELNTFSGTISAAGGRNMWHAAWKSRTDEPPQFPGSYGGDGTVRFLRDIPAPGVLLFIR